MGLLEWAVKLNPRHTWSLRVKRKPWEQHIYEHRSSKFCHQIHLEMKNSTQRKQFQIPTLPNNTHLPPKNSHPQTIPTFPKKTTNSPHFHGQKNGTLRCAPPGNERSCIRYLETDHPCLEPKKNHLEKMVVSIGSMNQIFT